MRFGRWEFYCALAFAMGAYWCMNGSAYGPNYCVSADQGTDMLGVVIQGCLCKMGWGASLARLLPVR